MCLPMAVQTYLAVRLMPVTAVSPALLDFVLQLTVTAFESAAAAAVAAGTA
jgi:hypothetical protein